MMNANRIIIDTDIGDDADDILAIALALTYSQVQIVGITTVFKNTGLRAKIAKHLLALADTPQIPVYAGAGHSLLCANDIHEVPCQYTADMEQYTAQGDAQVFLRHFFTSEKAAFVALGCLTNLAIFIEENPELVSNISDVYIMGGCFHRHANEWNIVCDPEAASLVFNSGLMIKCIGLDITAQCRMTQEDVERMAYHANTPLKKLLLASCHHWFNKTGFLPILHDPLVIGALAEQMDMGWRTENVSIELAGQHTRGMTVCTDERIWGKEPVAANVLVATKVNAREFIDAFIDRVFVQQGGTR
ncbi:nucleoside hydrolase [Scandinavium sp. TWS1a]|uniref:nucleoside hydrolase n=1 Tax=Scandinavium tedordense TaxID=2926521 RepID=UPI002165C146|nr:nucleoside hydrolase [Scandinavium tedordense]MCS2169516.1 nucleoside hydrolase [Scandinavium tedordense]